jgi:hypothetical protein
MRVAIYARVSTKDKGQSIDNQLPDLRRYSQVHQWDIYKEYAKEESFCFKKSPDLTGRGFCVVPGVQIGCTLGLVYRASLWSYFIE